jgi:hypothetical protein
VIVLVRLSGRLNVTAPQSSEVSGRFDVRSVFKTKRNKLANSLVLGLKPVREPEVSDAGCLLFSQINQFLHWISQFSCHDIGPNQFSD